MIPSISNKTEKNLFFRLIAIFLILTGGVQAQLVQNLSTFANLLTYVPSVVSPLSVATAG